MILQKSDDKMILQKTDDENYFIKETIKTGRLISTLGKLILLTILNVT